MRHAKVVVTLTAVLMVVAMASAQTPRQAVTDTGAVEALTVEIRALRAESAESARTSLRLQLLTTRVQAQEQRIIYLDRQRAEAAARRGTSNSYAMRSRPRRNSSVQARCHPFRSSSAAISNSSWPTPNAGWRSGSPAAAGAGRRERRRHRARPGAERWGDYNTRLDDLESTLGAR